MWADRWLLTLIWQSRVAVAGSWAKRITQSLRCVGAAIEHHENQEISETIPKGFLRCTPTPQLPDTTELPDTSTRGVCAAERRRLNCLAPPSDRWGELKNRLGGR